MVSAATVAYGLTFKKGSGTVMAEIVNLDYGIDRDMIEVTNLGSPSQAKEFLAGLIDAGEVTLSVNYLPANTEQQTFITDLLTANIASAAYSITLTDSGTSVFTCNFIPKSFKLKGEVNGKLAADFVLKGTGVVSGTATS